MTTQTAESYALDELVEIKRLLQPVVHAGEPFFTTKAPGLGTGLGLPMARGFAEQSGGAFDIESSPGEGTTATLWLPQAGSDRSPGTTVRPATADEGASGTGKATMSARLLVVDDEDLVREVLAEHLGYEGFGVLTAANGTEALALLAAREAVDALVTDLSMPGMDGLTLIRAAQERRPGLPAVLLTGYGDDSFDDHDHAIAHCREIGMRGHQGRYLIRAGDGWMAWA